MGGSIDGGTPNFHPFLDGIFPYKSSSVFGVPLWNPPNVQHVFCSPGVRSSDLGRPTPQDGLPFGPRQLPLEMCHTRGFPGGVRFLNDFVNDHLFQMERAEELAIWKRSDVSVSFGEHGLDCKWTPILEGRWTQLSNCWFLPRVPMKIGNPAGKTLTIRNISCSEQLTTRGQSDGFLTESKLGYNLPAADGIWWHDWRNGMQKLNLQEVHDHGVVASHSHTHLAIPMTYDRQTTVLRPKNGNKEKTSHLIYNLLPRHQKS